MQLNLPDGSNPSEIILPDGSQATEVRDLDGNVVWTAPSDIPDSVIHQYLKSGFTTSNWPDSEGSADIATVTGPVFDSNAFGSTGGVSGDGTDDYAQDGTMGSFGSALDTNFALSVPFNTTQDSRGWVLGCRNDNSGTGYYIGFQGYAGGNSGELAVFLSGPDNMAIQFNTDTTYNGGSDHHLIVNKIGNSDGGVEFYVDDMSSTVASRTVFDDGFSGSSPSNFEYPMTYFALNGSGTITDYLNGDIGTVRWFGSDLSESERQTVHDSLEWT